MFTTAAADPGGAFEMFRSRSHNTALFLSLSISRPSPSAPSALIWYRQKEARHRARRQHGQTLTPHAETCGLGRSGGQQGEAQMTFDRDPKTGVPLHCVLNNSYRISRAISIPRALPLAPPTLAYARRPRAWPSPPPLPPTPRCVRHNPCCGSMPRVRAHRNDCAPTRFYHAP